MDPSTITLPNELQLAIFNHIPQKARTVSKSFFAQLPLIDYLNQQRAQLLDTKLGFKSSEAVLPLLQVSGRKLTYLDLSNCDFNPWSTEAYTRNRGIGIKMLFGLHRKILNQICDYCPNVSTFKMYCLANEDRGVKDTEVLKLEKLSKLQELSLEGEKLKHILEFNSLTSLRSFSIKGFRHESDSDLNDFLKNKTCLEILRISKACCYIKPPFALPRSVKNLSLEDYGFASVEDVRSLFCNLTELKELTLFIKERYGTENFLPKLLKAINIQLQGLESLSLGESSFYLNNTKLLDPNDTLRSIFFMTSLKSLKLQLVLLKINHVSKIIASFPNLTEFDVSGCSGVTAKQMLEIVNEFQKLKILKIGNFKGWEEKNARDDLLEKLTSTLLLY